ncbi:MAG: hypothetical protein IJT41_08605 [Clostridia bacterium]|nr:hypothetical protein [Clostridia bacterium]
MKKVRPPIQRVLSVLLAILTLLSCCTAASFCFAENEEATETAAPSPTVVFDSYSYADKNRKIELNPENGTLTISGTGTHLSDPDGFLTWAKSIAPLVKCVHLTKETTLYNRGEKEMDARVFDRALSMFVNQESFSVEKGSDTCTAKDGVLYTPYFTYLIHYPAGKTDKSYTIHKRCMNLYPFAFCNVQHLETLEFPFCQIIDDGPLYSSLYDDTYKMQRYVMELGKYSLTKVNPETMEEGACSIRKIVWHGEGKYLRLKAEGVEGNDLLQSVEISEKNVLGVQKLFFTLSMAFYILRTQIKGLFEGKDVY